MVNDLSDLYDMSGFVQSVWLVWFVRFLTKMTTKVVFASVRGPKKREKENGHMQILPWEKWWEEVHDLGGGRFCQSPLNMFFPCIGQHVGSFLFLFFIFLDIMEAKTTFVFFFQFQLFLQFHPI